MTSYHEHQSVDAAVSRVVAPCVSPNLVARLVGLYFALSLCGVIATQAALAAGQRALLIGISDYRHVNQLVGPRADLQRMERFLVDHWGFRTDQIALLADDKATRSNILHTMEQWLITSSQPGDRIVVYYAGHGFQTEDLDGDEEDGLDEALAPVDVGEGGDRSRNQITDDEIAALLDRLRGRHVTVIVDACFSGTITRAFQPSRAPGTQPRTLFPVSQSRGSSANEAAHRAEGGLVRGTAGRVVWSASASYQYAWESNGEGLFTRYFVEGAADRKGDRNGNGIVTNAELLDYTRARAEVWCKRDPSCTLGFTPILDAPSELLAAAVVPLGAVSLEPTDVINQNNSARLELEIAPSDSVRLGQAVRFRVTSGRAGRLVLLDVNADGEVVQLFPNKIAASHGRNDRIGRNRTITVPDGYYGFQFTASRPLGTGTLLAIVMEDDLSLQDLLEPHGGLVPVADPDSYLSALASRLSEVWLDDSANRRLRWSMVAKKYRITE